MKEQRFDIHQQITNQIVAAIEAGAGEFRLPWHRSAGNIMRPVNIASKKAYRGVNILALWADAKGYESGTWGTYKQWSEAGAQVRKGERASHVVFYKEITVAADEDSEDENGTRLFARATPVFAAEQVEGYAAPAPPEPPANPVEPIERAEAFVAATGAVIHHGGSRAFYRRSTDDIHLPPREAFAGTATSSPTSPASRAAATGNSANVSAMTPTRSRSLSPSLGQPSFAPISASATRRAPIMRSISTRGCACSKPTRRRSSPPRRRPPKPQRFSAAFRGHKRPPALRCNDRTAAPRAGQFKRQQSMLACKHAHMHTWDHELSQLWSHAPCPHRRKAPARPARPLPSHDTPR
jgi:N-terminal domain of anti-restriction factor ArdC/Zincin-like metallopeptidase